MTTGLSQTRTNFLKHLGALLIVLLFAIFYGGTAQAAPTSQINYQGKLLDSIGNAVADGDYNMRFKLCTDSACSSVVFDETFVSGDKVIVTDGLFSVMIGSVSTTLNTVDFNQPLYLEVNVGGTGAPAWETLLPRKLLGTVPNAFNAQRLEGLATSSLAVLNRLNTFTATNTFADLLVNGRLGIGTTTPIAKLQVEDGNVLFGAPTTTETYTVGVPTNPSASIVNNSNGQYSYSGQTHTYRIYAYRVINGVRFYSASYAEASTTDNGVSSGYYDVSVSWDTATNADGYRVLVDDNSSNFDYYYDDRLGAGEIIDDGSSVAGSTVTPTTPYTLYPAGFSYVSTTGYLGLGTFNPMEKLAVVNGNIQASNVTNFNGSDFTTFFQTGYSYVDPFFGEGVAGVYGQSNQAVGVVGEGIVGVEGNGLIFGMAGIGQQFGVIGIGKQAGGYFVNETNSGVGLYVEHTGNGGAGLVIDASNAEYALSVSNASTTAYSIYSEGGINYFQNKVGIGTSTPTAKLVVDVGSIYAFNSADFDYWDGMVTTTFAYSNQFKSSGLYNSDLLGMVSVGGYGYSTSTDYNQKGDYVTAGLYGKSDQFGLFGEGTYGGGFFLGTNVGIQATTIGDEATAGFFNVSGTNTTGIFVSSDGTNSIGLDLYAGSGNNQTGIRIGGSQATGIDMSLTSGLSSYGLKINNSSTTAYSIYSEGGLNYFGGNVGVNTTTLTRALTVNGEIYSEDIFTTSTYNYYTYSNTNKLLSDLGSNFHIASYNLATSTDYGLDNYFDYAIGSWNGGDIGVWGESSKFTAGYFHASDYAMGLFVQTDYGTGVNVSSVNGDGAYISTSQGVKALSVYNGSSTNYSVYSTGGLNYFAGNTGIGVTNPIYKLQVAGDTAIRKLPTFGNVVNFTRYDGGAQTDNISATMIIARNDGENGLYNAYSETSDTGGSPEDAEWNGDGWGDLADVASRQYLHGLQYAIVDNDIEANILTTELVMHIISEDRYFKIDVTSWSTGVEGGFAYTRTEIFPIKTDLLVMGNVGIGTSTEASRLAVMGDATFFGENTGQSLRIGTYTIDMTSSTANQFVKIFYNNNRIPMLYGTTYVNASAYLSPGSDTYDDGIGIARSLNMVGMGDVNPSISFHASEDWLNDASLNFSSSTELLSMNGGGSSISVASTSASIIGHYGRIAIGDWTTVNGNYSIGINLGTTSTQAITVSTSSVMAIMNGKVGVGTTTPTALLHLDASSTTNFNPLVVEGSINNYFQINIKNRSNGASASSDVVATNDTGNENTGYIDMGINSSGYTGNIFGGANDSYLYGSSTGNLYVGTAGASSSLAFITGGTATSTQTRMTISSSGYVGIGTTSPAYPLDVTGGVFISENGGQAGNGTAGANSGIYIASASGTASILSYGSDVFNVGTRWEKDMIFKTNNIERIRISSSTGNVSITNKLFVGTNSDLIEGYAAAGYGKQVSVYDTVSSTAFSLITGRADADAAIIGDIIGATNANTVAGRLGRVTLIRSAVQGTTANDRGGKLSFFTKADGSTLGERMVIANNGYIGIGTSSPASLLHVFGSTSTIAIDAALNTNPGLEFKEANSRKWFMYNDNVNDRLYVSSATSTGVYLASGGTTWTANSDIRLKENIKPVENALEKILALTGYTYNFIGNNRTEIGLIAQEVLPQFPELVNTEGEYLGLTYDRIGPVLIQAIKEQQLQIMALSNASSSLNVTAATGDITNLAVTDTDPQFNTLRVISAATFYGKMTVIGEAGFESVVTFKKDAIFKGKIYVDKDSAGEAVIKAGTTTVEIVFTEPYISTPRIVANISASGTPTFVGYNIINKNKNSFSIVLEKTLTEDVVFDWIAVGSIETEVTESQPPQNDPIENSIIDPEVIVPETETSSTDEITQIVSSSPEVVTPPVEPAVDPTPEPPTEPEPPVVIPETESQP